MNWQRFLSIVKKEFIQIRRDVFSARIAVVMPIMMIFLFGYAVQSDVENINLAVLDQNNTQQSREYVQNFASSSYFIPKYYVKSEEELHYLLDSEKTKAALVIPPDFTASLKKAKQAKTQLLIDGTDPTIARTAFSSGQMVSQNYSLLKTQKKNAKQGIKFSMDKMLAVDLHTMVWYNPSMKSTLFTIPGLIGLVMQNITIMLTVFSLVRERERGTIEQLIVTPIQSTELILGKMLPYIIIGYLDFLFVFIFGIKWFGVPLRGSIPLFLILGFEFVIVALAIGILISTFAKNQLQAMQATMFIILPSVLLSGFMFPRESMPEMIQWIGNLMPLTYFLKISRGIILKGIGMEYLWKETLVLGVLGFFLLGFAILRFKKNLE